MPHIHIDLPTVFHFHTEMTVRISDVNYGNHLGHDALISMLHEARVQFLSMLSYSESDVEGCSLIMRDIAVQYTSEAFYGEAISIEVAVAAIAARSFDLVYRMCRVRDRREIARATTCMVFFDYKAKKSITVPPEFIHKIKTEAIP